MSSAGRKKKKPPLPDPPAEQLLAAEPAALIPDCPPTVKGVALEEWDRITALLRTKGALEGLDRAALAIYCQAWQRWVEAEQAIAEQGSIVRSPNGYPIQNPYLSVSNKAAQIIHKTLAELGLSPGARSRLKLPAAPGKEQSALENFLAAAPAVEQASQPV